MKVLFAVNNDKISEAVIKKYPKEYKELLSYKNVYYFNAILKEIQNDKSYDRIVISEDLEPFVNTNNDSIDNFIFNHLDKISDEAQGNDGREMSIILICSERRTFGSSILNKLFSIGIYNALIGNDRSMDNLCKLINRPRNKKEAKIYYKIDQATYEAATDSGEVSETEIQNILNHFKKLGKSTDRYTDSFNNIAAQYTDDQLKIIVNVLPIKVKAVLEAECDKYQNLMGTSVENKSKATVALEPGISVNTIGSGRENNVNGPIVIPSGIKRFTGGKNIIPNNTLSRQNQVNNVETVKQVEKTVQQVPKVIVGQNQVITNQRPVTNMHQNQVTTNQRPVTNVHQNQVTANQRPATNVHQNQATANQRQIEKQQQKQFQNQSVSQNVFEKEKVEEVAVTKNNDVSEKSNTQRYTGTIAQVKRTLIARRKTNATPIKPMVEEVVQTESLEIEEPKRGRGRPKKVVTDQEVKPKGKRGRPRKNVQEEENNLNDLLNGLTPNSTEDIMMPGLEETSADVGLLPGLEDNSTEEGLLSGLEEVSSEEELLPGLEDNLDEGEEVDVNSLLAGLNDDSEEELLPGLEDNSSDNGLLPGLEDDSTDDGLLPGLEDDSTDDGLLPGLEDDSTDDALLPGLEDDIVDDGLLLGLNDNVSQDTSRNSNNSNSAIESIKPQINYSMSNLNSLLSKDKKIVSFVGATKNGTSFIINNLALMFSMMGINTAILDMTQNKNSYYLFTDSKEELRKIAYTSLNKLENGYAEGINYNKNLTVYTSLPSDGNIFENAEPILSTLVQNHSLVLIDTDFTTPPAYFASSQEIYLVQSMDIMTIQPLTEFIRELKFKGAWEPEKARVVINKEIPIRILSQKTIVSAMSTYNVPDMSVMTELFNKDMVNVCTIPFDEKVYAKYLETLATCKLSISSLPKQFRNKLELLANMVYPRLNSKTSYSPSQDYGNSKYNPQGSTFSNNTNNILSKMKNNSKR